MKLPFVRRSVFEKLEHYCDTEIWRLQKQVEELTERERARIPCVDKLAEELELAKREGADARGLSERLELEGRQLTEENRELRHRYDTVRAQMVKSRREAEELRLMKESLEARLAAKCEI